MTLIGRIAWLITRVQEDRLKTCAAWSKDEGLIRSLWLRSQNDRKAWNNLQKKCCFIVHSPFFLRIISLAGTHHNGSDFFVN